MIKNCLICSKEFESIRPHALMCSEECRKKRTSEIRCKEWAEKVCVGCGCKYTTNIYTKKFCTPDCKAIQKNKKANELWVTKSANIPKPTNQFGKCNGEVVERETPWLKSIRSGRRD